MDIETNPWVCGTCGKRFAANGQCDACSDPLLDARLEDVRQMLIDDDARRAAVSFRRWLALMGVIATLLVVGSVIVVPALNLIYGVLPLFGGYIIAIGLLTLGLTMAAQRLFPPKRLFAWLA